MPLMNIFSRGRDKDKEDATSDHPMKPNNMLPEELRENLENDIAILGDEDGTQEHRLQKVAEREVQSAAEDSLKKSHIINLGRCPACGEHLSQHTSANICESCGWNKYDTPKSGSVRIHLTNSSEVVEGQHAYVLKNGSCLVIKGDVVYARIPKEGYSWIEYVWTDSEMDQRRKQLNGSLNITCGWCNGEADVNKDGFHMIHVAFGTTQERYCFCSDECYEAFRKMYPSRVHRNCYDRNCNDCNLCLKRYGDEAEGMRILAKDRLKFKKN